VIGHFARLALVRLFRLVVIALCFPLGLLFLFAPSPRRSA